MDFKVEILTLSIFILFSSEMNKIIASDQTTNNQLQTYIVHVQMPSTKISTSDLSGENNLESYYQSFLPTTIATAASSNLDEPLPRIVYPYHNIFTGFSAKLTPLQVKAMKKKEGFISAVPQQVFTLQTTHSPQFLGLERQNTGFWNDANYGKGVIIGLLDSGIRPDHPSFSDEGVPPPPAKWKGFCEFNNARTCNNKLIGARSFGDGNGTPMDEDGHGTHTAGHQLVTVNNAAVFGQANGTAAGIAPLSHIAMYNVCPAGGCSESSILAAMDTAIDDGVDVLSISLGGKEPRHFYSDNLAIGSFSAMKKGIFLSLAAGNMGPSLGTISNNAPWVLSVGASTINRKIRATAVLGNGEQFHGESAIQPKSFQSTQRPLVFNRMSSASPYCTPSSLRFINLRGKIVLCVIGAVSNFEKGQAVKNAGGVAMILMNPIIGANSTYVDTHQVLPTTHVSNEDGRKIIKYIDSVSNPTGTIAFKGTVIGDDNHSPVVASFSSRGPNSISPGILKPDIIGPGVNILAASPISVENNHKTKLNFNFLSGTSMACPHLSGVGALLKSVHPNWSPAAIQSAIMTTANVVNLAGHPIEDETFHQANVFTVGAGHVHPARASNPGLVYDIRPTDYIPYLCGLDYTDQQVSTIVQQNINCASESSITDSQLNYPSFS
ncbi:hypothetical protein Leryth_013575 [Lithospermum erythrorhizon]|nr:hypothetical protein Leryth_013575 [Lithospermum erythrorhizon]